MIPLSLTITVWFKAFGSPERIEKQMRLFFDFLLAFWGTIGLSVIPYLIVDLISYPFIFLVSGEFDSLTQIGLKKLLQNDIFPIGSLDLNTELKGLNIIVNSLVHSSLSVTGRWTLGVITVVICLGCLIFTLKFGIDAFREDKLSNLFLGAGFLLGGVPMIPIVLGGYLGLCLLVLEKVLGFF